MNIIVGWTEVFEAVHFWLTRIVLTHYLRSPVRVRVVADFVAWCSVSIINASCRAKDKLHNFFF